MEDRTIAQERTQTAEEILEHTNPQIARYKKIREVIFMDKIPISGPGKVLKKVLREQFN